MDRKLRMGMVGGGPGAFIGEVHRKAARMDGGIELVAGAFDIDPKKSRQMGRELCIDKKRVYNDYQTMLEKETALPEDERIDFVSVCTPNHTHFPIAKAFLEAGFNVMCEKPMTLTVKEAEELKVVVQKTRKVFGLMHTYTAYPMVKLARDMVRQGDLGKIRKVIVPESDRPVSARLAGSCHRKRGPAAGVLANRPEEKRCRRLHGRYRNPRRQSG